MIIKIVHQTALTYSAPVTESLTEVHLAPRSDHTQTVKSFTLAVGPPTTVQSYRDFVGNTVHSFGIRKPHSFINIMSSSVVLTHPPVAPLLDLADTWPLPDLRDQHDVADYLILAGPAHWHPRLTELLAELAPQHGEPVIGLADRLNKRIRQWFEYKRNVTNAGSTLEALVQLGAGVCQDFAHLMIAMLRQLGIPARYVSGYVHNPKYDGTDGAESHAWVELYTPSFGWIGLDPTARCWTDERFVRVAYGRDYTDVPPNRGVYRGSAREEILVRVQVEKLERMPDNLAGERYESLSEPLFKENGEPAPRAAPSSASPTIARRAAAARARQMQQQQQQ